MDRERGKLEETSEGKEEERKRKKGYKKKTHRQNPHCCLRYAPSQNPGLPSTDSAALALGDIYPSREPHYLGVCRWLLAVVFVAFEGNF